MTPNQPKVSIVIPVYGVEAYMERCARSLFEQTLDSLEYIFVNDCTPDDSMSVLRRVLAEYPERGEQVRIINLPRNMGAAKAREVGIKAATGEYIIHCDSDDWVDKDMYRAMYQKAKDDGLDYVMCRSLYYTDGINHQKITDTIADDKMAFICDILHCRTTVSLWNRLVRSTVEQSESLLIPQGHMMEDRCYAVQIAYRAQSYGCVDGPYYYYYQRPGSVCGQVNESACLRNFQQATINMRTLEQFLKSEGLYVRYRNALHHSEFVVMGFLLPLLKSSNRHRKLWMQTYPKVLKGLWRADWLSLTMKMISLCIVLGCYPLVNRIISKTKRVWSLLK